jgi:hypothetical protein
MANLADMIKPEIHRCDISQIMKPIDLGDACIYDAFSTNGDVVHFISSQFAFWVTNENIVILLIETKAEWAFNHFLPPNVWNMVQTGQIALPRHRYSEI